MRVALLCPVQPQPSRRRPGPGRRVGRGAQCGGARCRRARPSRRRPSTSPASSPGALVRLGRSVALPANGSVAPVALGPGAARRAVRAVRQGGFDVLHLHEPLAPGPSYACLVACAAAHGGDVPPGREEHRLHRCSVRWPAPWRDAWRRAVRCRPRRVPPPRTRWAGPTTSSATASTSSVSPPPRPLRRRGPTVMFVGRHEERKGLGVLLDAAARLEPGRRAHRLGGGRGPRHRVAAATPSAERPDRVVGARR